MGDIGESYSEQKSLYQEFKDALLYPLRVATSPTLLRTYLRTLILLITSSILFGIAVVAYTSFYVSYIPVRGIAVPIYLQYDYLQPEVYSHEVGLQHKWPFGLADVRGLVSRQKYDVVVEMEVPRSERNVKVGNWMVGLEMRGPGQGLQGVVKNMLGWEEEWGDAEQLEDKLNEKDARAGPGIVAKEVEKPVVLARSRRPAVLTYRSWMTEQAYRVLRLPLYIIGWAQESETMKIGMMENVEFERGSRSVPSSLRLELRSPQRIEVYRVTIRFIAKLEGLRYLMYHYRITSFIIFTTLYWAVEVSVVLFTWGAFSLLTSSGSSGKTQDSDSKSTKSSRKIKKEDDTAATATTPITPKTEGPDDYQEDTELSDTNRTFPTLPSQQPLHYTSSSSTAPDKIRIKQEEHDENDPENSTTRRLEDIPPGSAAAGETADYGDDEDDTEDADFVFEEAPRRHEGIHTDSGIGTSLESSNERIGAGLQRRRSARGRDGGGGDGEGGGKRE